MLKSKKSFPKSISMKSTRILLLFTFSVAFKLFLNMQRPYDAKTSQTTFVMNSIEDTITRANQTGWGTDADGIQPYVLTKTNSGEDVAGTGESVNFSCHAFHTGGNTALPCTPNLHTTPPPTNIGSPDSAHLIRSINDTLIDTHDQLMNDPTTQVLFKNHNVPIIRMPFRDAFTDVQDIQALSAVKNTGAAPIVIVHGACVSDPYTIDNHWLSLVAQVFTTGPVYVEYGNEEDVSCNGGPGISATAYQASWNAVIAQLKTNYPSYHFIGPVTEKSNPTYMATFVKGAQPQPDYISWHEYVCISSNSGSYCLGHIKNRAKNIATTNSAVQSAIGHTIPIMITEWNLDGGKDNRYSNRSFIQKWTTSTLNEWSSLTASGLYAAFNYTSESHPDFQLIDSSDKFTYQGAVFYL